MRILISLLLLPVSIALAAEPPGALETARRFAQSGALQLALDRVLRAQPGDPAAQSWGEWEKLHFELLGRLDRHRDLLARAAALPPTLPPDQLRVPYSMAVRAAAALDQGAETRKYAARVLWQQGVSPDELREVRLLVIQSYVADGRGNDAFLSMLRFEQDYRPLARAVAARFVDGLVDLGMAPQAVNWLARLDEGGARKLRLRFKAGLIDSAAALDQARALASRDGSIDAWRVIAEIALTQNNLLPHAEALERIVHALDGPQPRIAARSGELWRAYDALARESANQNQLLVGDYAGWGEFGVRRLETNPVVARALFGYLARNASVPEIRHNAQFQLVGSLHAAKLGRAALRLFADESIDTASIDVHARYVLGDIAAAGNESAAALRYWQDIPPPQGSAADEWPFRVAAVAVRSGRPEAAAAAVKRALAGKRELAPELVQRAVQVVQDMLAAGRLDDAEALFEGLLPLSEPGQHRQILLGLARINDATGRWPTAADYYLRSAMRADPKAPDASAIEARFGAALALARAGYSSDARAQFEWLLKHARDPVQADIARRELAKLKSR